MWVMFLLGALIAGVLALGFGILFHKVLVWMEREEKILNLKIKFEKK